MSLSYALVTSSSLPREVRKSPHYVSVDKDQWLDLVDYSQDLVNHDPEQKVLFLIVAKGTPEQEEADALRDKAQEEAEQQEQEEPPPDKVCVLATPLLGIRTQNNPLSGIFLNPFPLHPLPNPPT